jgi:hypothetical protein
MNIEEELREIRRVSEAGLRVANETFAVVSRIERKVQEILTTLKPRPRQPDRIAVTFGTPKPKTEETKK